jgi:hypothetical protein
VFQADCYIFNSSPYTIDYFIDKNLSYIGGNMSYEWNELRYHNLNVDVRNFNGGLSLRKTEDIINIIRSFPPKLSAVKLGQFETYGEDVYFTIGAYKLNLKVGDTKDDQKFACHSIITDRCFGIHNSDKFLNKKQLLETYPEIYNQPYIISSTQKKELINKNIYICNDGWKVIESDNIIFMETDKIDKKVLSNKKTPFILVTANNVDYPSGYKNDVEILDNPYLIKWFGTFPAVSHLKFSPLPLGPKTYWKKTEFLSEKMNTSIYDVASKNTNPLVHNRKGLLYCNFANTTSNPYIKEHKDCRIKLWTILNNINIPFTNTKSQKDYLTDLSNYVYCLCPPGNGCDSHRLWEALMMNCIPIVIKYEPLLELYKELPILILDKWEDLSVELLNRNKQYFANVTFNRELIYKKYYIDKIKKEAKSVNKILLYNGFPFHFEMFGCVLDYAKTHHLNVDIVNTSEDTNQWFSLYQKYFSFKLYNNLSDVNINSYCSVILLTDDDYSFPKSFVSDSTICINHFYLSRRNDIQHQLAISKFNESITDFCFPIWNSITHQEKKYLLMQRDKPIITLLGSSNINQTHHIKKCIQNYEDFEFILVNRDIPDNIPYFIKTCPALNSNYLLGIWKASSYVLYLSSESTNSIHQQNNKTISGSFPLAISNGCQLIIPNGIMVQLGLKSIIHYDINNPMLLSKKTDIEKVFDDRNILTNIRNNTLNNAIHYNKQTNE